MKESFIVETIANHFNISERILRARTRKGEIIIARHLCMYFCRELTSLSLSEIGLIFNRDHATVLSAVKSVNNQKDTDRKYLRLCEELCEKITGVYKEDDIFMSNDFYAPAEVKESSEFIRPFSNILSSNNREYSGYRVHSL